MAWGTVLLTILIKPPPTSFLYFTRARSGSMPVVSQSIMKPMVPVGAMTVVCALRKPATRPSSSASSQQRRAEISVAQAERAEVVRVLRDLFGGISGVVDDDLLRQNHRVHCMTIGFHVELAIRPDELH